MEFKYPRTFRDVRSRLERSGEPAYWPVTVTDAKEVLDFGTTNAADTRKIENTIAEAVQLVESRTQRAISDQTWKLYMYEFPSDCEEIELRIPPIRQVTSITYTDTDGATQTLSSSLYDVDSKGEPGRVWPAYSSTGWPQTRCVPNSVTVTFTAGYVETPVPELAIKAIKLAIKFLYYDCPPTDAFERIVERLQWESGL